MNCREAETLIVAGVYGRLTPEERAGLESHAETCPACRGLMAEWATILDLKALPEKEAVPFPDWEKSWSRISAEALDKHSRRRSVFRRPVPGGPVWARPAAAAAAVVLVFALGYFAGRRVLIDRPGEAVETASAASSPAVSPISVSGRVLLAEYADNLKPILVDFLNRGDVRPPAELAALERRIVRDMIGQTRLLENLAAESEDAGLRGLLLELEFILTSMANLDPEDKESTDHLGRMIREKDVALRLRDLAAFSTI